MTTITELTLLAIESPCDETGAAVMRVRYDDTNTSTPAIPEVEVLTGVVAPSMEQHVRFDDVVPEIASRAHLEALQPVVSEAHAQAAAKLGVDIFIPDAITATVGPGLASALLVGSAGAKAHVTAWGVPFYGINYLGGHAAVGALDGADLSNTVTLLVSGGHTQLLRVQGVGRPMEELGSTLDDATGETYDKVSRLPGLGYPGDPVIDKLAKRGNRKATAFPRAMMRQQDARHDFSFSGLKTAVARYVEATEKGGRDYSVKDVYTSFQEAICDVSAKKAVRTAQDMEATMLLLDGGITTNSRLRGLATTRATSVGITLHVPPIELCTDNGVMIGAAAAYLITAGAKPSGYTCSTDPSVPMKGPVMHQAVITPRIHVKFR